MNDTGAIAQISRARQFLAEAKDLADIKTVRDMAEAARLYARAAGLGQDAMNEAAEVKLRAERKAGEALARMDKNRGGQPEQARSTPSQTEGVERAPTLAELGLTHKQAMNWQAVADVPEKNFEEHISEAKAAGEPLTTAGVVRLARPTPPDEPIRDIDGESYQTLSLDDAEITEEDVIEASGGDDGGRVRIARIRAAYSVGVRATLELAALNPESVAEVLAPHQIVVARSFARDVRDWCDRLESALDRGVRLVGTERAHG